MLTLICLYCVADMVNAAATALNGGPVLSGKKMEEYCKAPDIFNATVLEGMSSVSVNFKTFYLLINYCICGLEFSDTVFAYFKTSEID